MERLQFREIADIVNRIGAVRINGAADEEREGAWSLHHGVVQSGGCASTVPFFTSMRMPRAMAWKARRMLFAACPLRRISVR